jgi:hypothetical protein
MKVVKEKLIDVIYESVVSADKGKDTLLEQEKSDFAKWAKETAADLAGGDEKEDAAEEPAEAEEEEKELIVTPKQLKDFRDMVFRKTKNKLGAALDAGKSALEYAKDAKNIAQEDFVKEVQEIEIKLDQIIFYDLTEKKIENLVKNKRNFIKQYRKVLGDLHSKRRTDADEDGTATTKGEKVDEQKKDKEARIKPMRELPPSAARGGGRTSQRKILAAILPQLKSRKKAFLDPATLDEDSLKKRIGLKDPETSKALKDLQEKARTSFAEAKAGLTDYMTEVSNKYNEVAIDMAGFSNSLDKKETDEKEKERVEKRVQFIEKNILGGGELEIGKPNEYLDRDDIEYIPYMTDVEWKTWTDILKVKTTGPDLSVNVDPLFAAWEEASKVLWMVVGANRKIAYAIAYKDAETVIGPDGEEQRVYATREREQEAEDEASLYLTISRTVVMAVNLYMNYHRGIEDTRGAFGALTTRDEGTFGNIFRSKTYQPGVDKMISDGKDIKASVKGRKSLEMRKTLAGFLGSKQPWIIPGGSKGLANEVFIKTLLTILDPTFGLSAIVGRGVGYVIGLAQVNKTLDDQKSAIKKYEDILGRMKKFDLSTLEDDNIARQALEELKILKGEIEAKYSDSVKIDEELKKNGLSKEVAEEAPENLAKRVRKAVKRVGNVVFPVTDDPVKNPVGPIDPDKDTLKGMLDDLQAIDKLEKAAAERKLSMKQQTDADKALSQAVGDINKTKAELDAERRAKGDDTGKGGKKRPKAKTKLPVPGGGAGTKLPVELPVHLLKRDDDFGIFEQKQNAATMGGDIDFGQMKEELNKVYNKTIAERQAYSQNLLTYYMYIYAKGMQDVAQYSQYAVTLGLYTNLYADAMIKLLSTTPAAAEPETQADADVDGSDDPITIKGKVPPQAPVKERVIRVSKNKLIDIIFEHLKEQTQTLDISKDQLVALVAQEAFKQINRKK